MVKLAFVLFLSD
ncbi:hypothetical protein Mgra_00001750 [Meloidogyne graminicola]|uniref:Uncharacterized protein n=1 Tax=Meloidogyne graminicola TaxID=189291 RepID=A0A8S9ZZG4_9BILA|nr:hypothetical protein Mgra_00001750 [Meloidogyne graminicola]